jgi:hypothetical protein
VIQSLSFSPYVVTTEKKMKRQRSETELIEELTDAVRGESLLSVVWIAPEALRDVLYDSPLVFLTLARTNKALNEMLLRDFPEIWRFLVTRLFLRLMPPLYGAHFGFFGVQFEKLRELARHLLERPPETSESAGMWRKKVEEMRHLSQVEPLSPSAATRLYTAIGMMSGEARVLRLGDIVPIFNELWRRLVLLSTTFLLLRIKVRYINDRGHSALTTFQPPFAWDAEKSGVDILMLADCLLVDADEPTYDWTQLVAYTIERIKAKIVEWATLSQMQFYGNRELVTRGVRLTVDSDTYFSLKHAHDLLAQLQRMIDSFDPTTAELFLLREQDDRPWRDLLFTQQYGTPDAQRAFLIAEATRAKKRNPLIDLGCSVCGAPAHFTNKETGLLFCQSADCHKHNL